MPDPDGELTHILAMLTADIGDFADSINNCCRGSRGSGRSVR